MEESINVSKETREKEFRLLCHQPYPWLMLRDEKSKKGQIFYSITEDRYHIKYIPEVHINRFVICSNKKWLAVQEFPDGPECFLLNMSTMEKLQLPPPLSIWFCFCKLCVLSSPTMDDKCRIILFSYSLSPLLSCNLGDTEFIKKPVILEDVGNDVMVAVLSFEGKIYALTVRYNLLTADISDPNVIFKPIIKATQALRNLLATHGADFYLVESRGELMFVYTRRRDYTLMVVKIFRADFNIGEWVNVESLGDRAMFIDAKNCFSSPASKYGLRGNCAYIVNEIGRNLFVFDLEDQSMSISLPCPIAKSNSSMFWMNISDDD